MNRVSTSVRIVNNSDTPFTDRYDSQHYAIPAKSEIIAPYDAAALWLGDPALFNFGTSPTERERTNELHRVQRRCGYHDGLVFVEGGNPDGDARDWSTFRPQLSVYTTGPQSRELKMVAEDPDGQAVNIFDANDGADKSDGQKLYELQQQMADLLARADGGKLNDAIASLAADGALASGQQQEVPATPPVDSPTKPKVSASTGN